MKQFPQKIDKTAAATYLETQRSITTSTYMYSMIVEAGFYLHLKSQDNTTFMLKILIIPKNP
jgi:hypothetical protein